MYKTSLVITTINKPNKNMKAYESGCKKNKWNFIIVGDKKTPKNFKLAGAKFINYKKKFLEIPFSKICPLNTYARKNIGYLYSISKKTEVIVETDDDNRPLNNFFYKFNIRNKANTLMSPSKWINIYNFFLSNKNKNSIWPRGLPLPEVKKNEKNKIFKRKIKINYVIQSLCNGNPDVDAIFRLLNPNKNDVKFFNNKKFFISKGNFVPFNSQSTIWYKDAFPLLYLPVTCSFRSTDIWRSLIAQIILNNDNKEILFQSPTVFQKRNKHNLMDDFVSEIPVYIDSQRIINSLKKLRLKKGKEFYIKNLKACYKKLVLENIIDKKEIFYLNRWIQNYNALKLN